MADKPSNDRIRALKDEILMAQKLNEEELEPIMVENLERYVGKHIPPFGVGWDIVLNEIYPVIQNLLPSIFFRTPRAFLKPKHKTFIKKVRDPASGKMVEIIGDSQKSANTQEGLLNYQVVEMKYKKQMRKVLLDALLFPHGILWHGYKGDFGMTEEQSFYIRKDKLFVKRIMPLQFIKDPSVSMSNLDEARWVGREIDIPFIDFIEDDKLDIDKKLVRGFKGFGDKAGRKTLEAVKKQGGGDIHSVSKLFRTLLDFTSKSFQSSNFSTFVRVQEIYLRPTKKEQREGKKGWILLLTNEQDKPLRVSEWTTKAEGFPAKILEFNELPDSQFALPDIETYKHIADQKNVIINQQIQNAQATGKVWVGLSKEGTNEEDVTKVQQGQNTIITFESGDPRQRMYVASAGGQASSELYTLDGRIQQNLEDKSGVSDLKRGFLRSGEESATSVRARMAGSNARPAYRQDIMTDFLKDSFLYINQLDKQFMTMNDAVRIMGTLDIEWTENPTKEDIQADVDVDIDAISMLPENPESELKRLNETLFMMIQALTQPAILQKLQQEGKTIELSPVIEQIFLRQKINDPSIFRNIKPEESQGYVSVQQIRQAKENVTASLRGTQIPFPPTPEDDHLAKLEVYGSIKQLLDEAGQVSDQLNQLMQVQMALLQQLQQKQSNTGQPLKTQKPKVGVV